MPSAVDRVAYLDHAATTPMLPEARDAVYRALGDIGNASSLHSSGRRARRRVEESRESLAAALGARPSEVIFTAGGTEADNLAIKGLFWARRDAQPRRRRIVISAIEHHAVLDSADWLAGHERAELVVLPVDRHGLLAPDTLRAALAADPDAVALVSLMWANNEVGTVQPIAELAEIAHEYGALFHTDAVQAVASLPVDFAASGVDALSLTGHKLGGTYGTGALLLGREVACVPLLHGGGQERDIRSGTLDLPGVVGLATATALAVQRRDHTVARVEALRHRLINGVTATIDGVHVSGHPTLRLPNIAHLVFDGCEGDALLMLLDARGVECSTGSACSAGVARPSHVLLAMGASAEQARGSLRFSLGHCSVEPDVDAVLDALPAAVQRARSAGLSAVAAPALVTP